MWILLPKLLLLLFLTASVFCQQIPMSSCYRRRCDQLIEGRQLSYERALEIINSEEYLTAADLDLVRRRHSRFKRQLLFGSEEGPSDTTPLPPTSPEVPLWTVAVTTGVISLGSLAYLLLPPGPPVLTPLPGMTPPSVPQPGQPGGGARPVATSPTAAEAISLAPLGTVPVAIFPPFLTPRTVPAIAVIFSESSPRFDSNLSFSSGHGNRRSRQQQKWQRRVRKHRQFGHRLGRFLDKVFRKRRVLQRKYGFVVKVTLVDEMCQLGVTCDINGNVIDNSFGYQRASRRQTGEEFSSTAPPDCRTIFVGCTP